MQNMVDGGKSFEQALSLFIVDHSRHNEHIEPLAECYLSISKAIMSLNLSESEEINLIADLAIFQTLRKAISEINGSLIISLKVGAYSSVEALARVSIENTANLIYIMSDETGCRSSSFLYKYLDSTAKTAKFWHDYCIASKNGIAAEIATQKINNLKEMKLQFKWKHDLNTGKWPKSSFEIFKNIGAQEIYQTIYSTTSDSIHSFSEDCYNLAHNILTSDLFSPTQNALLEKVRIVEKASFAIFCAAQSLHLFCQVTQHLAHRIENDTFNQSLKDSISVLENILKEHNDALLHSRFPSEPNLTSPHSRL